MSDANEPLAAILAEMREYFDLLKRGLIPDNVARMTTRQRHQFWADRIEAAVRRERAIADAMRAALVEILDRTNREKARDYDAALNGGILEIHDIANTTLNQERAADALEKARAPGSASAMTRAQLQTIADLVAIAHDEYDGLPSYRDDLERFDRRLVEIKSEAQSGTGNAAAMREALENLLDEAEHGYDIRDAPVAGAPGERQTYHVVDAEYIIDIARAALSAPARNCDRFATVGAAHKAWRATDQERDFADWLFATAEGVAK